MNSPQEPFAAPVADKHAMEEGAAFRPRFSADGLITAVVVDAGDGTVLMVAHMNAEALAASLQTGIAHFWSRSRGAPWKKGETSGNLLRIEEIGTDCDQDVLLVRARIEGDGVACHTGRRSCFYRRLVRASDGAVSLAFAPGEAPQDA